MSDFIIDPQSASVSTQRNDLILFLESLPDADKWTLFFQSITGQTLIDLLAGFSAFLKYESITARREAYIQSALNRSSIVAASQNLGYSVYRGRNAILKLNVTPLTSGVWPKYTVLGTVKDRDIILLESVSKNAGVALDVNVTVGVILNETIQASGSGLDVFRFSQKNVSEDVRIYIDTVEVAYAAEIVELLNAKFCLQSNPFGSVDAKYLNSLSFPTRYSNGSDILLEWIELKDTDFTTLDVAFDITEGAMNAVEITELFNPPETDISAKVNAPLNNDTKFVIRAREDQPKILRQLDTSIIDAKGEDVSAAVMRLFYLRTNDFRFSTSEKTALIAQLDNYRPHGLLPVLIGDPVRVNLSLKIDLYLSGVVGNVVNETKVITQSYANLLQGSLDMLEIESQIEALSSIKVARVQLTGSTWVLNTSYEIGTYVKASPDTGKLYQVGRIRYFSSGSEPTWPVIAGNTINDGDIVWKAVAKDDPSGFTAWTSTTDYISAQQVKPTVANGFIYEVVDFRNFSGASQPTWTPIGISTALGIQGTTQYDNDIIWMARVQEGTPPVWTANTRYVVGDLVIATNQNTSDTVGVMFQCFGFVGKSGGSQPSFPMVDGNTVNDNNIVWITRNPTINPANLAVNQYYKIVETITVN